MIEASGDFGGRLRHRREDRGVSLRSIADTTKISILTLEALEKNDIMRLPGGIFSRAVVRAYAQQVGADPEATVREFMSLFPDESVVVGSPHHVSHHDLATQEVRHLGRYAVILAGLIVAAAALGFAVWKFTN
jgi:cytoskeletal protein RodZ